MTQPPYPPSSSQDDRRLVRFLQQHRLAVPTAAPDLEFRLMQTVEQEIQRNPVLDTIVTARRNRLWLRLMPPAILATLLLAWTGYRLLTPPKLTPEQIADLEFFMENTWDGSVSHGAETELSLVWSKDDSEI